MKMALENASNPDDFKLRVAGISSGTDSAREEMQAAMGGGGFGTSGA